MLREGGEEGCSRGEGRGMVLRLGRMYSSEGSFWRDIVRNMD